MVKKNKQGIRSNILLDEVDLNVLKILEKSKKELGIGEVQEMVGLTHMSFKGHVRRLISLKLLTKERIPKTYKFILKPTENGKKVIEIFN